MKKTCVGCSKKIPAAARNCFFCGERQPEAGTAEAGGEKLPAKSATRSKTGGVTVVGPDGTPKRVTGTHPSQTFDTLMRLDDQTKEALRDAVKRSQTPASVPAVKATTPEPAIAPAEAAPTAPTPEAPAATATAPAAATAATTTSPATGAMETATEAATAAATEATPPAAASAPVAATPARTKTNVTQMMTAVVIPETTPTPSTPGLDPAAAEEEAAALAAPHVGDVTPVKVTAVKPPPAIIEVPATSGPVSTVAAAARTSPTPAETEQEPAGAPPEQWALLGRVVMALGGVMMLALFALSSQMLAIFSGAALALHLFFLMGGVLLVGAATMPLPARVRGGLGAILGAVAVFLAAPSLEGFGGWRGVLAALAFTALPGGLLLRARHNGRALPRLAVLAGVGLVAAAYLVPGEDGSPLTAALALLSHGPLLGLLALLPMLLALLALSVSTSGKGAARLGPIWAAALLVAVPAAVSAAGMVADDRALVHLGVTLLAAGGAAAMGLAEAFAPDETSLHPA